MVTVAVVDRPGELVLRQRRWVEHHRVARADRKTPEQILDADGDEAVVLVEHRAEQREQTPAAVESARERGDFTGGEWTLGPRDDHDVAARRHFVEKRE